MAEEYRCYFISRDGTGRTLASIGAENPTSALEIAKRRFHIRDYRSVEVWHRCDRVLVHVNPTRAA
jgi:hypothetical protein